MPYCPKCKYVFQSGIGICPDCEVPLVEYSHTGRTAAMVPDDSWVVVGGVIDPEETQVAKGSLDSSNIPSMVLPSRIGWFRSEGAPSRPTANDEDDGNLIMVPREFHGEAAAILDAVLGEDYFDEETME